MYAVQGDAPSLLVKHPETCFSCPINWPERKMWVNTPAKSHFQTKARIFSIVVAWVQNKWSTYRFWSLVFVYILESYFVDTYFLIWYNLKQPKTQIPKSRQCFYSNWDSSLFCLGTVCYLYSLTGSKAVDLHPGESSLCLVCNPMIYWHKYYKPFL